MARSQPSSGTECPLDLSWLDDAWSDFEFDFAGEYETQHGKETEGRNLVELADALSNPAALEFRLQEETPSQATTPLNLWVSNAALPFSPDRSAFDFHTENSDVIVDNADASHGQGGPHHCLECNRSFRLEKDLRRHRETTKAHQAAVFQCCCTYTSGRKDTFLKHVERKTPCSPVVPFICSCGYSIESSSSDAIALLLEHVKPCGQRKRGRPKKSSEYVAYVI
ncbi:hypothetical protein ACQKWADRAFT_199921 [Trichoderma austrokoningii]